MTLRLIWRCRSCYHKKERTGCPMCVYWRSKEKHQQDRHAPGCECECGYVTNVFALLVAGHRCGVGT